MAQGRWGTGDSWAISNHLPEQELWPNEEHLRQQWPRAGGGQVTAGPSVAIYLSKTCGPMKSTGDSNGPGQVVDRRQLGHQQPIKRVHQLFSTLPVQGLWPNEEHLRQQWPRAGGGQETACPSTAIYLCKSSGPEEHWRQRWPRAGGGQETAGPSTAIYLCKGCGPMKSTGDSNGPGQVVDRRQLDHQPFTCARAVAQ